MTHYLPRLALLVAEGHPVRMLELPTLLISHGQHMWRAAGSNRSPCTRVLHVSSVIKLSNNGILASRCNIILSHRGVSISLCCAPCTGMLFVEEGSAIIPAADIGLLSNRGVVAVFSTAMTRGGDGPIQVQSSMLGYKSIVIYISEE